MTSALHADVAVRPATPTDAATIAALQLEAWSERVGPDAVTALDVHEVERTWGTAIATPPDARGRVLVATAGPRVVGFAATAPSSASLAATAAHDGDAPADDGWTAELVALEIGIADRRLGHGSRLLAAVVDLARERGAHHVAAWTLQDDAPRTAFLEAAGLAEAGVRRVLDVPGGERTEILLTGALGPREAAPAPHDHTH